MKKIILSLLVLAFPTLYAQTAADGDPLLQAMSEELSRSYEKLRNAEKSPLYFLQYEAWDEKDYQLGSNLGVLSSEGESAQKTLTVDVRVGSRELDNTHEVKGKESNNWEANSKDLGTTRLPVGDKDAIKVKIWELTDRTYKDALNKYLKVEMNKQVTAGEQDKSGDFSADKTTAVFYEKVPAKPLDREKIRAMLNSLSLKFKEYDFIINSGLNFHYTNQNRYIANSEGARIVTGNNYITLSYSLSARTADGMDLSRYKNYNFDDMKDLPGEEAVAADIAGSVSELKDLIKAPLQEPFTGPAILENRAAAVFWHEIFGHRMEGHRQKSESEGQTFAKKIGENIMPDFLTVYDDPNIREFGGQSLRGCYKYDDEGVKAGKAGLVENGVLKGFLMQRVPIDKFPSSNGHGRRSEGNMTVARQGNLMVESSKKIPYEKLREMLIEEVKKSGKPYGLIIKDIAGGFTITQRSLPQSYTILIKYAVRVYPDGRPDEPIRGLNMIGTPLATFPKIIYTGDDDGVFNGTCGAESGWVPVSAVSPSLLFSEIETEKVRKSNEMPPALKPPYFDR
ncbi:MAG: peptidase U62 [Elusimicrobia bacterium CG08_land_8_20_14_0_20_51_18]|nr:MAG: peptidase U62 [Elusimicrobia bacterium CG08_land_8_20_14_0_20_51_18]